MFKQKLFFYVDYLIQNKLNKKNRVAKKPKKTMNLTIKVKKTWNFKEF